MPSTADKHPEACPYDQRAAQPGAHCKDPATQRGWAALPGQNQTFAGRPGFAGTPTGAARLYEGQRYCLKQHACAGTDTCVLALFNLLLNILTLVLV